MDITSDLGSGVALIVFGIILIQLRKGISQYMVKLYLNMGIDIPEDKYSKQFVFIGILFVALGFLVASGLIHHL
jgi:hypothetical protein